MRAVVWEGKPYEMAVRSVPKPRMEMPEDAIVRVTTAAICGSDLHTYHGVLGSSEPPWVQGHEAIGIIVEVGPATETFKVGDRVIVICIPDSGHFVAEPVPLPGMYTIYGFGKQFGGLGGCQAEYVRVPFADDSLVKIPNNPSNDLNYLFLSDVFATGWQCLDFSGFRAGDNVAVFGAGAVGLLCAYSAILRGASKVYVIDHVKSRLDKAASIGAIPIDFTAYGKGGAAAQILELEPEGVQRVCDCIGCECLNEELKLQENYVIVEAVNMAAINGGIGLVGVYLHVDVSKGTPRADLIPPTITFPIAAFFSKNLSIKGGLADVLGLNPTLLQLVNSGRAKPGFVVTSEVGIEDAPEAYRRFDQQLEEKVVIRFPWESNESTLVVRRPRTARSRV
ncbi:putative alcohol dehydrogenase [Hypomontagnella submonticulosa]|nr:putative alcohol dehydrogenase [Hypomontagnella submonticulosa]